MSNILGLIVYVHALARVKSRAIIMFIDSYILYVSVFELPSGIMKNICMCIGVPESPP